MFNILDRREAFFRLLIVFKDRGKIALFAKVLVHDFGQKFKTFTFFVW